jgi:DNA-binding HxlR family transcriptional regulator
MSPSYGNRSPRPLLYSVPDWLLGGQRKRLVLQALNAAGGMRPADLVEELGIGRATVFETLRALRDVDAIQRTPSGTWRLNTDLPLGAALGALLDALASFEGRKVDRPPRARDR